MKAAAAFCTAETAPPIVAPGARLKLKVTDGNWPWWLMATGAMPVSRLAISLNGTAPFVCDKT